MNSMKKRLYRTAGQMLVALLWVLAPVAFAGNAPWSGGANNNWTDAGNWVGGAYPGATSGTTNPDIASFTNNPSNKAPAFNVANINLGGFTFDIGAGAFTLGTTGGNAVLLSSGGSITVNSGDTAAQIVNAPLVIQNASGGSSGVYTNLNNSATSATLTLGGSIKGMATTGNTTALTIGGLSVGANTVSGIISDGTAGGAVSLTKVGSGIWVLSGINTYTGATVANGGVVFTPMPGSVSGIPQVIGTLQITGTMTNTSSVSIANGGTLIDGSSTAASNNNVTNRINPAATLTMGGSSGGGTFTLAAPAAGSTHSQTLAGLSIGAGGNTINASAATGTNKLSFSGASGSVYSRSTGGTVTFATTNTAGFNVSFANTPTGAGVSGTSAPLLIGAILGGTIWGGTDFVAANSGTVAAPTYDTTLTADKNVNVTGNLSGGPLSVNSLRLADTTSRTVILTGTNTIASGGILLPSTVTADSVNHTITGGYLTSGTGDLWIYAASGNQGASPRSGGANGNPRGAYYAMTIASPIIDNGTTPVSLTIGGSGYSQVHIISNNTYTGGTYLDNGMLAIDSDSAFGASSGAVTVTSGANNYLRLNNAITNSRNFVINSGAVLNVGGPTLTLNGSLTGGGNLMLGFYGSTGVGLILNNDENGFTGTYTVGSALRANEGVGLSANANLDLASDGGNAQSYGCGTLQTSANVTRSLGTGPGQVQFTTGQGAVGGGFSAVGGPVTVSLGGLGTPATLTYGSGAFGLGNAVSSSLVLQDPTANNTLIWANPIANNGNMVWVNQAAPTAGTNTVATMTGVLSGTGGMTKEGLGLLILSGTNTYTGQTRILKGTLSVASLGSVNGATSNLGQPSSATNGTIVLGGNGGYGANAVALTYTGSGETTDRILEIATTIGKITLEQAGTGLLKFASPIVVSAVGDAGKTLILQGSTSGTGELSGGVIDGTNLSTVAAAALGADRLAIIAPADVNYGQLRVGNRVSGKGIAPGTYLTAIPGNSTTGVLSQATTEALTNGQQVVFTGFTTVTKTGTNLWNVLGANTYSGITTVSNGVLGLSGNLGSNIIVKGGAKLSAGAAGGVGTLSTAGLMTFETNSRLLVDVASATADTITAVGNVTLTGTVTLEVSGDQLRGGSWKVLESTGGTITGSFVLSGARSGSKLTTSANSKEIWLTIPPKGTMIRIF
ncbi:MAG: autotransporter-associated beta strand repeat-containing protein [bacterium]